MKVSIGIVAIFITTFLLVFTFFTMIEYNLSCTGEKVNPLIPKCTVTKGRGGDFILGLFVVGILTMVDMGIVYKVMVDFFT